MKKGSAMPGAIEGVPPYRNAMGRGTNEKRWWTGSSSGGELPLHHPLARTVPLPAAARVGGKAGDEAAHLERGRLGVERLAEGDGGEVGRLLPQLERLGERRPAALARLGGD